MNLQRICLSITFLLSFNFYGQSQVKYVTTDLKNIREKRKELILANKDWDRKKLYQLGSFFEKIYDKYRDSSMNTAIHCYTIAASSESEYGGIQECYKAANRLAKIYESGKGVPVSLHRAMIYYYLGDAKHRSTYNTLGNPVQNANFQRVKKKYCNGDMVALYRKGDKIDSVVIGLSPFCSIGQIFNDTLSKQIGQYLRIHPEATAQFILQGRSPVPAAQYTLKAENFVLPRMVNQVRQRLMEEEGIAEQRLQETQSDFSTGTNLYQLIIKFDRLQN